MRGEFRIREDLVVVEKVGGVWREVRGVSKGFENALRVARMFRKHGNLGLIISKKDSGFLKGLYLDGRALGERIDVLPDGTKLDKAFPLFGKDLVVHDEKSAEHWDVIFRNPSGAFCYLYAADKVARHKARKFERVDEFERLLPKLRKNLMKNLDDVVALAIAVLLETRIRVGSEVYYKRNRHKGLSTLKKKNLKIKGDKVLFDFVGKDGVPQSFEKKFSGEVLNELSKILKKKKLDEFVFLRDGKVLRDTDFESGFERFCGVRFYPHIVRSAFATRESEKFLKRKNVSKDEVREFYSWLAGELGHKKFSKKSGEWVNCYEVTLHHYVRPDLVAEISRIIDGKK